MLIIEAKIENDPKSQIASATKHMETLGPSSLST